MTTTRSGRKAKPAHRIIEAMSTEIGDITANDVSEEIFCYHAMFTHDNLTDYSDPLIVYKVVSDLDSLYYHEAMRERAKTQFQDIMHNKEVSDQFENGNITSIVPKSEVSINHQTILPVIWQMKRKRDEKSGAIKKYKARLSIDGSRMQ